jgi:glycerophosphoryl diester phosphodiesterase
MASVIIVFFAAGQCWAKMVIAKSSDHFLPGASLPALAITIAQGAEFVHLNLAMSADNQIIILGDTVLNEITNAAELFPDRSRKDGSYHVMDFTLEELQQLSLARTPGITPGTAPSDLVPLPQIRIATLNDALDLIKMMQHNLSRRIEIIAEIKKSWQYKHENRDISRAVIDICRQHGYTTDDSGLSIASYDPEELQRIHDELFAESAVDLKIFQLIEENSGVETQRFERGRWLHYNYDWLYTKFGIKAASAYADMISLRPDFLVSETGDLLHQEYVEDAHILGLKIIIHPIDYLAESLPAFSANLESFLEFCLFTAGADGLITEKDLAMREFIKKQSPEGSHGKEIKTTIELLLENLKREQQNN